MKCKAGPTPVVFFFEGWWT